MINNFDYTHITNEVNQIGQEEKYFFDALPEAPVSWLNGLHNILFYAGYFS